MTLEELMRDLPWGLHDAHLVRMTVDYDARTVSVDVRLQISERQATDQLARLLFTGLESFAALPTKDPPERENDLAWIDQLHEGPELEALRTRLRSACVAPGSASQCARATSRSAGSSPRPIGPAF